MGPYPQPFSPVIRCPGCIPARRRIGFAPLLEQRADVALGPHACPPNVTSIQPFFQCSVSLAQLHLLSLPIVSLPENVHPEDRAHAERPTSLWLKPGTCTAPFGQASGRPKMGERFVNSGRPLPLFPATVDAGSGLWDYPIPHGFPRVPAPGTYQSREAVSAVMCRI